ncbi:MAG: hypothetical protein M1837_000808 [Sclerophora amabilis]|nr:MAG: hypothetical protein M1837_000808 [Sclerophora amabilis]
MNLGNATLKTVTASRPDITRTPSRQSISASDHFYSYDEHNSDISSHESDAATAIRWETPLSQVRSPVASQEKLQSEAEQTETYEPLPSSTALENGGNDGIALGPGGEPSFTALKPRGNDRIAEGLGGEPSFTALETGRNDRVAQGPRGGPSSMALETGGNVRTAEGPGEGPSVVSLKTKASDGSPPTPGVDDTPYIRYAIDQITRHTQHSELTRATTRSSEELYPTGRIISEAGPADLYYPLPRPSRDTEQAERSPSDHGVFIPVEPPSNSLRYPDLHYVPAVLRPWTLGFILLLCLLMIAALMFCGIWSAQHDGLWDYDGGDSGRFFVFQFLPQIFASILVVLIFTVETAALRVLPFTLMASTGSKSHPSALLMDLFPTNFIFPYVRSFHPGNVIVPTCLSILWLSIFTIPIQSSLFQVRYVQIDGQGSLWRWAAVQPVVWTLVAIYILLAVALLVLTIFFFRRKTGLMWDPTSLADILCMLHRCNSLDDYSKMETLDEKEGDAARSLHKNDRLGYWKTRHEDGDIFYGLGEEGAPSQKLSSPHTARAQETPPGQQPATTNTNVSFQTRIYSPQVRYRFIPWFLRDTFVVAWIVTAFVLLIAFLVVSFVNRAVQDGFRPLLGVAPDTVGFSSAGFLYSFIPSLVGLMLFVLWQSIDMHFRALQPFANMSDPRGASADDSLLLDYPSCLPIEVTIKALVAGHWKVAWISFISLLSITFPILGGGVFWAVYFSETREVRMVAQMPAFYALIVFLILYAVSFLVIWPRQKRHLPHGIRNLADIISFVHQSPILDDVAFRDPRSKIDLVTRLLGPSLRDQPRLSSRYAFGIYHGRDGTEHLGIDRLHRPGSDMIVTTGKMR